MPVDDLGDPWAAIRELQAEVKRLKRANPLEAASVTSGRVRFIGGTLRVDSGGRVEIVGTLQIDGSTQIAGTTQISGPTTVTGAFTVEGPWSLTGNGDITGATTITGPVTVTGKLTQNGVWELNGNGKIQGDVDVTGGGKITAGNVVVEPNKITIGAGTTLENGELRLANGSKLTAGDGAAGIRLLDATGTAFVRAASTGCSLESASSRVVAGNRVSLTSSTGLFYIEYLPTGAPSGAKNVLVDPSSGRLYREA